MPSLLDRLTYSNNMMVSRGGLSQQASGACNASQLTDTAWQQGASNNQVCAMQVSQQTVHGNMVHQVYDLLTGQLAET